MSNVRRPGLELPRDLTAGLPAEFVTALNDRLRKLGEHHELNVGLRGTVEIAAQKTVDEQNNTIPGLAMRMNRIGDTADPIYDQDVVTYAFLKRQLACKNLARILSDCQDHADIIDDEVEPDGGVEIDTAPNYIIPGPIWPFGAGTGTSNTVTSDNVVCLLFCLPFSFTFDTGYIEVSSAVASSNVGYGMYSQSGSLLWGSGAISAASVGVKTTSLGTITMEPGMYWWAWTSSKPASTPPACYSISVFQGASSPLSDLTSTGTIKFGVGTGGSGGTLPGTLPTLSAPSSTSHNPLLALLELA